MDTIKYIKLNKVDPKDFLPLLNNPRVREHLIEHPLYGPGSVKAWIDAKMKIDSMQGCKIRAIIDNNQLIGWCGIQLENQNYEIAIMLDDQYWGIGKKVFLDLMRWAKDLGHDEVFIHFLHTRPQYKFLTKISRKVYETEFLGNRFITYQLKVK